jgi:hypothetical protein
MHDRSLDLMIRFAAGDQGERDAMTTETGKLSYAQTRKLPHPQWVAYNRKLAAEGDEVAKDRVKTAEYLELMETIRNNRGVGNNGYEA